MCGNGSCVANSIYETQVQIGGGAGGSITYAPGNKLYASVNGFVTNVLGDAYEYQVNAFVYDCTEIGVVKVAPDANSSLLVFDMRV